MESRTFTTPDGLKLELRIGAGSIEVETRDITETTLEIDGERDPDDFRIEFSAAAGGGHRLIVDQLRRRALFGSARELHVRVQTPIGTQVQADTGSAELIARGRIGSLAFRSGSGDVSFERVDGDASIKVASGDVHGDVVAGDLTANSASGDVRVGGVGGSLVAHSASGEVEVDRVGGSAKVATASGDITVGGVSSGEATLRSVSGDIEVGIVRGTSVWLDLSSVSGDVTSELAMGGGSDAETATLELRAASVSGDIHVGAIDADAATA